MLCRATLVWSGILWKLLLLRKTRLAWWLWPGNTKVLEIASMVVT